MENTLLNVENLTTLIANNNTISFQAKKGDVICIFGLNGSGKSVLLKTICGILGKKSGNISYNVEKNQVGVCLQFPEHLIFKETALDEALLIMDNDKEQAKLLLQEINADESTSSFYLSDGQKRLLFIYGYLKTKDLIILDEPFVSLDDISKIKVANKIQEAKKLGKSIIYTANRNIDKEVADKVVLI